MYVLGPSPHRKYIADPWKQLYHGFILSNDARNVHRPSITSRTDLRRTRTFTSHAATSSSAYVPRSPCPKTLVPSFGNAPCFHRLERVVSMAANSAEAFWTGDGRVRDVNEAISRMYALKCRLLLSEPVGEVLGRRWKGGRKVTRPPLRAQAVTVDLARRPRD